MKNFFALLFLNGLLLTSFTIFGQENSTRKPNIIFILTDDLGVGDVGVFFQNKRKSLGNSSKPSFQTPHLDQIAAEGAKMTQNYCNAPVCAPSRASLMLGVHQGHSNVRDSQFDKALEDNYTMAGTLKTIGYKTAVIGKWGLQGDPRWDTNAKEWPAKPLNRGFDYFFGYMRHSDGHEHYPKEGLYRGPKEVYLNEVNIASQLDKSYTGDLWTAAAKKWIADAHKSNPEQPFFMYLSYDTPHAVLELPTQQYPPGKGLHGGLQWLGKPGNMINTASGKIDSWMYPEIAEATYDHDQDSATPEIPWPDVYKRYATSVQRLDEEIGDLMQLLKDLNIDDNTMVVFTSDNGPSEESYLEEEYSPEFFRSYAEFDGMKRDTWEGGVRLPTLVKWPAKIRAGKVINTPSISSDWMATFLNAANYPAPIRSDGVSLIPSLTGKGKQDESLVYIEYFQKGTTRKYSDYEEKRQGTPRNQMQMIRMDNYVGVRYDIKSAKDNFEIYNVVRDPKETTDLAGNTKMKDLQQQMKDKVLQVRRPDAATPRPYDNELVPAVRIKKIKGGALWNFYRGFYPWIPATANLKPEQKGRIQVPMPQAYQEPGDGVIEFHGFLNIPADGEYTFSILADKGAYLKIHGASVIDADYSYNGTEKEGSILLKAGLHPFNLLYKSVTGSPAKLDFQWKGPGISKQRVPANVFLSKK